MDKQLPPQPQIGPALNADQKRSVLLLRSASRLCAIPLAYVVETMRPQPIRPMSRMPDYIEGLAIIRGNPVPIVHLASLFEAKQDSEPRRLVVIRLGARLAALSVDDVIGIFELSQTAVETIPPLLTETSAEIIGAIGRLDREFLIVLEASCILPPDVWRSLESEESSWQ